MAVTASEVTAGTERLGFAGDPICLHSSLRSFPRLVEGPATLIEGLLSTGSTVMGPTMANWAFDMPAPPMIAQTATASTTPRRAAWLRQTLGLE